MMQFLPCLLPCFCLLYQDHSTTKVTVTLNPKSLLQPTKTNINKLYCTYKCMVFSLYQMTELIVQVAKKDTT